MSIVIYTTEYLHPMKIREFEVLINQLPEKGRRRALGYRRWEDAYGFVLGKLLLLAALKEMGYSYDLANLSYSPYHKPFFLNGPHFSTSHSGNRVVCALSKEKEIGIDIEHISKAISISDFKGQLTSTEWCDIGKSANPEERFLELWTAKESLIKADGRGLEIPLSDLEVIGMRRVLLGDKLWDLQMIIDLNGYVGHIAMEHSASRNDRIPYPDNFKHHEIIFRTLGLHDFLQ
jgi:4'-phosphopantetheinyl transferase